MPSSPTAGKRARSQPPPKADGKPRDWLEAQSTRLDAGAEVFGGLAGGDLEDAYKLLYTQGPTDALTAAQKLALGAKQGQGLGKKASGAASSSQPSGDWLDDACAASQEVKSHYEANLMQNRFGEDSPTMFNPARHTVVVCGRPVQATLE